jgi:hypothetical protein
MSQIIEQLEIFVACDFPLRITLGSDRRRTTLALVQAREWIASRPYPLPKSWPSNHADPYQKSEENELIEPRA